MGTIQKEMSKAIDAVGATGGILQDMDSEAVVSELRVRFATMNSGRELWEDLTNTVSYREPSAWRWISDYSANHPCLLAIPPRLERAAFEFANSKELVAVLGECSGFVFYVTDAEFSYVLCFNDHDYLIAGGAATDWLRSRLRTGPDVATLRR